MAPIKSMESFDSMDGTCVSSTGEVSNGYDGREMSQMNGHTPTRGTSNVTEYIISSDEPLYDSRTGKLKRTKYAFDQFEMPPESGDTPGKKRIARFAAQLGVLVELDQRIMRFMTKLVVLLSRSSGIDKVAAFFQYGCLFWGSQPCCRVNGASNATWRELEESMSAARKVLRLGKWVKEYEKTRLVLTVPGEFLGILRTNSRIIVTRLSAILMHSWAGAYYFIDNMVWAAQIGFVNGAAKGDEAKRFFKRKVSYEKYLELQKEYAQIIAKQDLAKARTEKWKNWKNNASLYRLIFAIIYSIIQIDSLSIERKRLQSVFSTRIGQAKVAGLDSEGYRNERDRRICEVDFAVAEAQRSMLADVCNLLILLSRLKYPLFKRIPLWFCGILGVIAACCGIQKNWPTQVPKVKKDKVIRSRCESIEKNGEQLLK